MQGNPFLLYIYKMQRFIEIQFLLFLTTLRFSEGLYQYWIKCKNSMLDIVQHSVIVVNNLPAGRVPNLRICHIFYRFVCVMNVQPNVV